MHSNSLYPPLDRFTQHPTGSPPGVVPATAHSEAMSGVYRTRTGKALRCSERTIDQLDRFLCQLSHPNERHIIEAPSINAIAIDPTRKIMDLNSACDDQSLRNDLGETEWAACAGCIPEGDLYSGLKEHEGLTELSKTFPVYCARELDKATGYPHNECGERVMLSALPEHYKTAHPESGQLIQFSPVENNPVDDQSRPLALMPSAPSDWEPAGAMAISPADQDQSAVLTTIQDQMKRVVSAVENLKIGVGETFLKYDKTIQSHAETIDFQNKTIKMHADTLRSLVDGMCELKSKNENAETLRSLAADIRELKAQQEAIQSSLNELRNLSMLEYLQRFEALEQTVKELGKPNLAINTPDEPLRPNANGILEWKLENFSRTVMQTVMMSTSPKTLHSDSFYTDGYRLRAQIYVPSGHYDKEEDRDHVGVYIQVVKGEHDEDVPWPMQKIVTVEVVNKEHVACNTMSFTTVDQDENFQKPIGEHNRPFGFPHFLPLPFLDDLQHEDESLHLRISVTDNPE
ncbi:hypothetical protein [Endozoicomonas sp. ONNA2]|uniref:hypothetical protein n=1 Tax=Endozoicomonas sp. ONNA2 TaxID=2828741 RepID=UPI0021497935|nr:hypothetical protein [Endozoicomonas sp. ONNA2]